MKKAQLQLSFHLIFVLIGGILFFTFFLLVLKSMLTTSESHDTRSLTNGVNTIVYNALPNTGSFDVARIPSGTELYYDCKLFSPTGNPNAKVVDSSFIGVNSAIPGEGVSDTAFRNTPIFMPTIFKGDKMFTKTYTWKTPMKVTNLVVVTNNRTKYYFQQNQILNKFYEDLPPINKQTFSSGETIKDEGYDSVRIILFGTNALSSVNLDPGLDKTKVSFLVVDGKFEEGYELKFYNGQKRLLNLNDNTIYYGDSIFHAAIFQDDYNKFKCDYHKLLDRYDLVKKVIEKRLEKLQGSDVDNVCKQIYSGIVLSGDIGELYTELESKNRQLLRRSCPLIY